MIRIGDRWLADFASCNYLGFDLDREIIDAVPAALDAWGTHPSWSRLLGSPVLYEQIEERLTELIGSEDSLVLPTITHIHMSVIPLLAASGTIFLDERAHKTIYDGCQAAKARGAAVRRFRFEDPDHLDQLMAAERDPNRLVCMDGVNSMTGNPPDLGAFAAVARRHGALLYVDDAHGFGVIGERGPGETSPYGMRGNSIVRYAGETYDNLVLVARLLQVLLVAAGVHRLPDRDQADAQGRRVAVPVLRAVADRVAGDRARRLRRQRAARRRAARAAACADGAAARRHRAARHRDAEPLGAADRRDPAARPPADRRGRAVPVRPGRLRHARRLPARAEVRGRLPRAADGGEHRGRGRRGAGRAGGPRRARPAALAG